VGDAAYDTLVMNRSSLLQRREVFKGGGGVEDREVEIAKGKWKVDKEDGWAECGGWVEMAAARHILSPECKYA